MTPTVTLKVYGCMMPSGAYGETLLVTINGRQALHEGPRRPGYCVYCKGQCRGFTPHCDCRVYDEAKRA